MGEEESIPPNPTAHGRRRGAAREPHPAPCLPVALRRPQRPALAQVRPHARAGVARRRGRGVHTDDMQHERPHVRRRDRARRAGHGLQPLGAVARAHAVPPARGQGLRQAVRRDERRAGDVVRVLRSSVPALRIS